MSMAKKSLPFRPEIWGGIECTISRIHDNYSDQCLTAGHYSRHSDIGRIAELGITTLRYPVLWEHHQPTLAGDIDWAWTDRQLSAIRDHRITPIAGLLHHGSGPLFTRLDDPGFAGHFAAYAGKVAARFPWIEYYTPVNEPLTTARFSGLYGIWYPHKKDPLCFMNMLLNQIKGVVDAMKLIRRINPVAKLVQTEDLAKVHSTPTLSYQADFENERRWLTYDILCGRLDKTHPLWDYLLFIGIKPPQLSFFTDNPCPPDILGVNYYVTSERFLDADIHNYPSSTHGSNGVQLYADVEAVRAAKPSGLASLLKELDKRYKLPVGITEVHLNCTREEQSRWLYEIWRIACNANQEGMDIRGVTPWALLGAYDWDSLLTRNDLHYESGAYRIKDGALRLTAVGHIIKALATKGKIDHPLLKEPGWWDTDRRIGSIQEQLLIFGDGGSKTEFLMEICRRRGIGCQSLTPAETPPILQGYNSTLDLYNPWGVIELSSPEPGKELETSCYRRGIPYLALFSTVLPNSEEAYMQIDHILDLFIDKTFAMTEQPLNKRTEIIVNERKHLIMG
jgi:dTDP-4-dehydrorhamnose reductase